MKFSLNLNKIALLRNARGENNPSLEDYANQAIDLGVDGLTLHPRPDHRHATSEDVISLSKICRERDVEFNIEGNPFSEPADPFQGYVNLVNTCQPDQATLVPDLPNQITSDHGWESGDHDDDLITVISNLNNLCKNTSISLFVDNLKNNNTNLDAIDYALKVGANTIEIHTGEFSKIIDLNNDGYLDLILGGTNILNTYPTPQFDGWTDQGGLSDAVQIGSDGAYFFTALRLNL